ncbi:MAG: hypothetical protein K2X81_07600 [Candidatus Obscuribacterales bacterium]|nr:hypothetical protein [Candidatus Obscuribacterales bacterium]
MSSTQLLNPSTANVGECIAYNVDKQIKQRWKRIRAYELDDPSCAPSFSKGLAAEVGWDADFTQLAIDEYKKFTLLSSLFPESMVPSIHVDTVWHWHLLFTKSYQKFCREALGQDFLHHQPGSGDEAENKLYRDLYKDTLAKYEELFGIPPASIWGQKSE